MVERDDDEVRSAEGAIISAEVRAIFPSTEVMLWAAAFTRSSPSEACFRAEPESPTDTHTHTTTTGQVRTVQVRANKYTATNGCFEQRWQCVYATLP